MKYSAVGFVLAVSLAPCATAQIDENVEARTSRPCFGMVDPTVKDDVTNTFGCSLRASNDSTDIGAARPAAISYTADNDGDDSYAVHAALTVKNFVTALQGDPLFGTLKTSWDKDNTAKKKQDAFSLGVGLQWDWTQDVDLFHQPSESRAGTIWSVYVDADASFNRTAQEPDLGDPQCVTTPSLRACDRQYLETARLELVVSPWTSGFEFPPEDTQGWYANISPFAGVFWDSALNDDVALLSGTAVNGDVLGVKAGFQAAVSPAIWKNIWELGFSGQIVQALDRDSARKSAFEKSSRLFTASISYALAGTFVGQKTENTWLPAIALTYTNGSNSLKGQKTKDTLALGLTVKY